MASKGMRWAFGSLAVALLVTAVALGQNAMQAEPTAVAVVNVQRAFNNLQEKQAIESQLKQRAQKLQQQQKQKQQAIQQMRSDLDLLEPGTKQYKQKQSELERQVVDYKAWQGFKQKKMEQFRGVQMQNLYRKVSETAGSVAKDNGYDIVLYHQSSPNFNFQNMKQVSQMIQMRKVLWSRDKLNITDQVIQRMNNNFQAGG
jgi:Skp family chaperone for outer membrane proteins